jgi:pimeloyl-ACP methyl ester carboxylesterase
LVNPTERARWYAGVPAEQRELLWAFREGHPYKEAEVGGARWRYLACGEGRHTLLFLAGGFLGADMWFHSIRALERRYRILAPDSFTLQPEPTTGDVVQATLRLLDAEGVDRATPIGLSAGGGLGQILVQAHADRVEHLVLSHTGVLEGDPAALERGRRVLRLVRILPLWAIRAILLRRTAGRMPPSSRWIAFHNAFFAEAAERIDKAMVIRFLEEGLRLRQHFPVKHEALATFPGEVLLLGSKDDAVTFGSLELLRARFPHPRVHIFEEGGHHTFLLFPEAYTSVLVGFLDEVVR